MNMIGGKRGVQETPAGFCEQIALMLGAGIPLSDGLESLADDTDARLRDLARGVEETGSLSEALRADGRWPAYLVEMAAIGERTGQLEEVMRGLGVYYAREARFRRALAGATAYPMTLGGMLVLIVLVMLWKVFPVFRRVLAGLGVGMTGTAGRMMSLGAAVGWLVLALVLVALVGAGVCMLLMRTPAKERVKSALMDRIAPLKRLRRRISLARISSALSMLLSAGIPLDEALVLTQKVVGDDSSAKKLEDLRTAMLDGEPFAEALAGTGLFDGLHCRMIRMGAAAGREDEVMAGIAADLEEQVEEGANRLVAVIEPTLVALLTVVIGAMLLSVMLPMAGILSNML